MVSVRFKHFFLSDNFHWLAFLIWSHFTHSLLFHVFEQFATFLLLIIFTCKKANETHRLGFVWSFLDPHLLFCFALLVLSLETFTFAFTRLAFSSTSSVERYRNRTNNKWMWLPQRKKQNRQTDNRASQQANTELQHIPPPQQHHQA